MCFAPLLSLAFYVSLYSSVFWNVEIRVVSIHIYIYFEKYINGIKETLLLF